MGERGLFSDSIWDELEKKRRTDPDLIAVVERLGEKANGKGCCLKVVEVPDDVDWEIACTGDNAEEEVIEERHRTWW